MNPHDGPRLSNSFWHDLRHRRQMEGYTHVKSYDENDKEVYELVYTGDYYRLDLPRGKRIALRVGYLLAVAVMAAAFLYASSRRIGANLVWYAGICQMLVLCCAGKLLMDLLSHATAPRPMTVGDWKGSSRALRRSSRAAAAAVVLCAIATIVYLVTQKAPVGQHALCVALYFVAAAAVLSISLVEARIPYTVYPSRDTPPEDPFV